MEAEARVMPAGKGDEPKNAGSLWKLENKEQYIP